MVVTLEVMQDLCRKMKTKTVPILNNDRTQTIGHAQDFRIQGNCVVCDLWLHSKVLIPQKRLLELWDENIQADSR